MSAALVRRRCAHTDPAAIHPAPNKTGQSIQPGAATSPDLVAYFHDLTITAHDAIFGNATGDVPW